MKHDIITNYEVLKTEFEKQFEMEAKKYPLSDREKIFINTINHLLSILDEAQRVKVSMYINS